MAAPPKGLDECGDSAGNDIPGIDADEEFRCFGEFLLRSGTASDIVLEVHSCVQEDNEVAVQTLPNECDSEERKSEHEQRPKKLRRTSAADKDIGRSGDADRESLRRRQQSGDASVASSSDEFAISERDQAVLSRCEEQAENGDAPGAAADRQVIVKQYHLHRDALRLCLFFRSKLSVRWNGAGLDKLVYATPFSHAVICKCLKLLYFAPGPSGAVLDSVSSALSVLSVFCRWNFVRGIERCVAYLRRRLTSYNVGVIYATASRLNRFELLDLCRGHDPTCNLLSISKMKEVLVIAIKLNRAWAKQIAEKEFNENFARDRGDINSSFLKDVLNAVLLDVKVFLPLKGHQWLAREIQRWMSDVEQFEIWSAHSDVISNFNKAHNISITNPKESQFVSHKIRELLNQFIVRMFVASNIHVIPWQKVLAFLKAWAQHIHAKSMSSILSVSPPMFQSNLCECCIDWIATRSFPANAGNAHDQHVVLAAIMKCQERAKFWEKTTHRNVFAKSPVLRAFSPHENYGGGAENDSGKRDDSPSVSHEEIQLNLPNLKL